MHGTEHEVEVAGCCGLRVERRLHPGDEPAEGGHEVDRALGARGVPARPAHPQLDEVGCRRDRPGVHAHGPRVELGVAVDAEHRADAVEPALADDVDGTARHRLLRRLEDQPHRPGDVGPRGERDERARRTEDRHGVRVVAAGVGDAVDRRAVADVLLVGHRQRVDVGPQRDDGRARLDVADGDVAHQARTDVEALGREAEVAQVLPDVRRGRVLLPAQLGVRVEVAAHLDEHRLVGGDQRGDPVARTRLLHHGGEPSRATAPARSRRSGAV